MLAIALFGCPSAPLPAALPAQRATYEVAAATASGDRRLTTLYSLEVTPSGPGRWSFATLDSLATIEEGGSTWTYSSGPADQTIPWAIALQQAIAAVPAEFQVSRHGLPTRLVAEAHWKVKGRGAIDALGLPEAAEAAADNLLDADGLLRSLQSTFPGTPRQRWEHPTPVAGLPATCVEECDYSRDGMLHIWRCTGTAEGPQDGGARLYEVSSTTVVQVDRFGLVSMESSYSGTLVTLAPSQDGVVDRPIAGRRLVQRQ